MASLPDRDSESSAHVHLTRELINANLQLDRLLALTYGHAPPGIAALELVLPAMTAAVRHEWIALAGLPLSAAQIVELGNDVEGRLTESLSWDAAALEAAVAASARGARLAESHVHRLASLLVLGHFTPLSLPGVLAVMGRESTLTRLRLANRAFRAMQMVG
jgi:hypothetical protein